jgi:hypothetical protein
MPTRDLNSRENHPMANNNGYKQTNQVQLQIIVKELIIRAGLWENIEKTMASVLVLHIKHPKQLCSIEFAYVKQTMDWL